MSDIDSYKLVHSHNSSSTTVDDLFTHLTIPQIQKLAKEYKQNSDEAKNNLHSLVGNKYRDLIKIAEDINDMNAITLEADQKLAQLSYSSSNFVSFSGKDSLSKFNSNLRAQKAAQARQNSKITILRNLIFDKLMKLDLKLAPNSSSPPIHTSILVYYAKVYYSMECNFSDTFNEYRGLKERFEQLKTNFNRFIEYELARYSLLSTSLYSTNDRFRANQRFSPDDLYSAQQIANDQNLEFLFEYEEEETNGNASKFEDDEYINSKSETYNQKVLPIVNYLIAYVILNSKNPQLNSLSKIIKSFLSLRWKYIGTLIEQLKSEGTKTNINFFDIFKFYENTLTYVDSYFLSSSSELIQELKVYTKSWTASDILGFKNWIEMEKVNFPQNYCEQLNKEVRDEIRLMLNTGIDDLVLFVREAITSKAHISDSVVIFHNFVLSFKNLSHFMISNDSTSKFVEHFQHTQELSKLLDAIITEIKSNYESHFDSLINNNDSILSLLTSPNSGSSASIELFSKDMTGLMEEDIEKYIYYIAHESGSGHFEEVGQSLEQWFDFYDQYSRAIQVNKSDMLKLSPDTCLSHLYQSLLSEESLGDFSANKLQKEFTRLSKTVNEDFWSAISKFVDGVNDLVEKSEGLENMYLLLEILISIKARTLEYNKNNDESMKLLESIVEKLYSRIIEEISASTFGSISGDISSMVSVSSAAIGDDFQTWPSLKLSVLMYKISSMLLSGSKNSDNYRYGNLFLNEHFGSIFQKRKREWLNGIIEKRLMPLFKELPKENTANARVLFANIVYLLQFTETDLISDYRHSSIKHLLSQASELVDSDAASIIVKGVADFYRSNKDIYLPLGI